ncbi:MAG: hypothetical protein Q7T70_02740 [Polaromonas sp.]|nr:hypothetical protein [Polaromonas sp.]
MVTKKPTAIQKLHYRHGEGHTVDVTIAGVAGNVLTSFLDLSSLPVPDRRFSCDAVGVDVAGGIYRLLFAQRKPVGSELLSMLVINMAPESVEQFLATVSEKFLAASRDLPPAILAASSVTQFAENADQSVVLNSSVIMTGYSGSNGCMDFYYASPFAVQQIATLRKMALESIVRVNLPTGILLALIKELQRLAKLSTA